MAAIGHVRKKHRGHGPLLRPLRLAHKHWIYVQLPMTCRHKLFENVLNTALEAASGRQHIFSRWGLKPQPRAPQTRLWSTHHRRFVMYESLLNFPGGLLAEFERLQQELQQEFANLGRPGSIRALDRKSTRLNSSHSQISHAVFF